jgi:predicted MFS family arabinose efflux permease
LTSAGVPWARLFLPFAAGYYLSYLLRTVNAVISPDLTRELGLSAADLGLLTGAYFFSFAVAQIPVGVALDRYGPRRVEACLLVLAAAGALLFAFGQSLLQLAAARALIGFGVSACLMAALKAFSQWYPPQHYASMTGQIMAAGALGAISSTLPLELALPVFGWRGVFVAVAVAGVATLLLIAVLVPDHPDDSPSAVRPDTQSVASIFRSPVFWRFAPQAALFGGGLMAMQSLWSLPFLTSVAGLDRMHAAEHLMAVNLGMFAGQLSIAAVAARLLRHGVTPLFMMEAGLVLVVGIEAAIILLAGGGLALWFLWGVASATSAQVYGVVAGHFPLSLSGRAATAVNLMAFVGAFAVQWGYGGAIDFLQGMSLPAATAHQLALALLAILQGAAFLPLVALRQGRR